MRLLLSVLLLLSPSAAWAARYAIIGADNVVITVIESDMPPAQSALPTGGYSVALQPGSGAESGGTYANGVFSPRPKSTSEIISEKLDAAIDANVNYLKIATPTNAQAVAQVQALTRQVNGMLRLLRNRLDSAD